MNELTPWVLLVNTKEDILRNLRPVLQN